MVRKFLAAAVMVAVMASPALAGPRPMATITFAGSGGQALAAPTSGSQVTFAVNVSGVKDKDLYNVWVGNRCWGPNGSLEYVEYAPVQYSSYRQGTAGPFTLQFGGGASCQAYVFVFPNTQSPLSGATLSYATSS